MKHIIIFVCLILLFSNCTTTPTKTIAELEHVVYIDVTKFDDDLADSTHAQLDKITITTIAPISINQIPPRLEKWLTFMQDRDGKIEFEPKLKVKAIGWMLGVLPTIFYRIKNEILYGAIGYYNAKIFYNFESGEIDKIEFIKKSEN